MDQNDHKYTNALIEETSPYLLQHAHNPVDWHAWNDETLEKAKKENKLLIISVGYAACHWCHVMEHESFEDSTVAAVMNEYFLPIKVDREERPDVDDVYMTACQMTSRGGCGWPLNAFALPDGRPVWAGTYFPKDKWLQILEQFKDLKENNYQRLEETAQKITDGIKSFDDIQVATGNVDYNDDMLSGITEKFLDQIDMVNGGKVGAPKFPMPNNYEYLLNYYQKFNDKRVLSALELTLDKMAYGGIYDQLGGGFARYSVDALWLAPHFEKMLYDNGQLVSLYARAYQVTKKPLYEKVVKESLEFIERELMNDAFGFYSSLDADSEGEEGKFYVFDEAEIDSIIGDKQEANVFKKYFSIKKNGNWEHTNILAVNDELDTKDLGVSEEELATILKENRTKLFEYRSKRIRPGLDDKILTSWNGLMLKGYVDAFRAFGDNHYLQIALKNGNFISREMMNDDGRLDRNFKNGKSSINGFLDDYASTIDAFVALYEVTFDIQWLDKAELLSQYVHAHFFNEKTLMYNFTSDLDAELIARKMEVSDNVIPASNSMMARNFYKLGTLIDDEEMKSRAKQMLGNMRVQILDSAQPSYFSNWCQLMLTMINTPYEIAILGENAVEKSLELQKDYLPQAYFLGGKSEGNLVLLKDKLQEDKTMIYVCQNKVCKFPVEEVDKARALIK